ncbi:hypothetical protein N473_26585 [Pseudoalteromonas luteoviolacea CPMOR-1]|uniref:Uncharacterized protein n=1 Tax=Pseudoalteromonas luteoviolacea CPMOR-1 TaxID=1365248 RepID=A0A167HD68_9GAMM|nr:hypothetical protein [Pseudoalteromonas luteoviolacea]KZN57995.1 hypothetical protein N473_26585 [Pseudoalteromonas luteoviolacea CPMOR-1]
MVEHEQLLKFAKDEDDIFVMLFIAKVGGEQYYGKTILDNELIELLCGEREPSKYSEKYLSVLTEIRKFIDYGLCLKDSHYLAFEGP